MRNVNNIKVSVIVPVYNVEKYLRRCLDSIIKQSHKNIEIILVNDGSTDGSLGICEEYCKLDERVILINQSNMGMSGARNSGLDIMTGEYVTFVDSDDYIHPEFISRLLNICINENCEIAQCGYIRGDDNIFPVLNIQNKINFYDMSSIFWSENFKNSVWAKLYCAKIWKDIRMPIGKKHEDDAVSWRAYMMANRIGVTSERLYYYYANPNSIMGSVRKKICMDFIDIYKERILFFKDIGDELMIINSEWRFCLPLMMNYLSDNTNKEEKNLLITHFDKYYKDVIKCRYVPLLHRILFVVFKTSPYLCEKLMNVYNKRKIKKGL